MAYDHVFYQVRRYEGTIERPISVKIHAYLSTLPAVWCNKQATSYFWFLHKSTSREPSTQIMGLPHAWRCF